MTLLRLRKLKHILEAIREMLLYHHPSQSLVVVGVTGTDGKTTTATLIQHILTTSGRKTGISSTLGSAHMTTYGRGWVHKFLWRTKEMGCTHAVVEVTSHGIDQNRVWGVKFAVGVLTNIANNEHLDYHGSFEKYQRTKINFLLSCPVIVANADDPSIDIITKEVKNQKLVTYGIKNDADFNPKTMVIKTKLIGEFNTYNVLAAMAAAKCLGVSVDDIKKALATYSPPSGRLEQVVDKPFKVIVDFAHTPQAFEKVLPVVKKMGKRLIHVFGCTGNRDRAKRPIMGMVAAKYDDVIILTHEDTYSEDPEKIINEIAAGITKPFLRFSSRRVAIAEALKIAKRGDVVLLTGVGHQKSMNIGGKEIPWSEQKIVKELLHRHG